MSDDRTPPAANGAAATDADVNITAPEEDHPDSAVVPKLRAKIQVLEQDLVNDKLKIKHLEDEISSHESDKRALNSIAASASELEIQFSSLQHDLISSASDLKRKLVEFEAKERENVEIEFERNLLLEKLKEYEEKVRELQIVTARKFEVLLEKLKECEAKQRENSDKLSELEAGDHKRKDKISELKARQRKIDDKLSESEARKRKIVDKLSELKARKRKIVDKLNERDAIGRKISDKISELEAREREKRIKLIH
ncbi:hypothetical protein Tco_1334263 [Tanacetum coccineum]